MRRTHWSLTALAVSAIGLGAASTHGQVVISQVNGNGGLNNDAFEADFIELFNKGTATVDLTGWSVQIFGDNGSATTPQNPTWNVLIPLSGMIQPGQYYLIRTGPQRGTLSSTNPFLSPPLPEPDVLGDAFNSSLVSNANGVALMSNTTPIGTGNCPVGMPGFIDLFRYGRENALCFEGSGPSVIPGTTSGPERAAIRLDGGCADTNDSAADIITWQIPQPRNTYVNGFVLAEPSERVVVTGAATAVTLTARRGDAMCNPLPGQLSSATADLSAFGLSGSQAMFDNGTNGDASPGDGVFSYQFTVPASQAVGRYDIPISGTSGATTLPASAVMRVFPTPAPNGACEMATTLTLTPGVPVDFLLNTRAFGSEFVDSGTCDGNGSGGTPFPAWFSYTATANGAISFSEFSTENIVFSVHPDVCGNGSSQCIDEEAGAVQVTMGSTYFFRIGRETANSNPPEVPYDLRFEFIPTPSNDEPCGAELLTTFPASRSPLAPAYQPDPDLHSCNVSSVTSARYGVWYRFMSSASPGLLVINEDSINSIAVSAFIGGCMSPAEVACDTESSSQARLPILTTSTEHHVLITVNSNTSVSQEPYELDFEYVLQPANDDVCNATPVTGALPQILVADARAATDDIDPGTCNSASSGRYGMWYEWTAPANGTLALDELTGDGSGQDLVFGVWAAADCSGVFGNATFCQGNLTGDRANVPVTGGQKYFIQASIQSGVASIEPGVPWQITIDFLPAPSNDLACNATEVTSFPFQDTANVVAATNDVDIACNFTALFETWYGVWYTFTPANSGYVLVSEPTSDDTAWGLFTGPDCNSLSEVECRDGGTPDAAMYFTVEAGVTYHLLGGKASSSLPFGALNVNLTFVEGTGGCCTDSGCSVTTRADCLSMGGDFRGEFTGCFTDPNGVDTASQIIPDGISSGQIPGIVTSVINISDNVTVSDLKVGIDLEHNRIGDLRIILMSPQGTEMDLINRIDTNATCTFGTQGSLATADGLYIFDDQATNPWADTLALAADPFGLSTASGYLVPPARYKPTSCNAVLESLNTTFGGQAAMGNWTLTIRDERASTAGLLNGWQLYINGGTSDPCATACPGDYNGDDTVDLADLINFNTDWQPNIGLSVPPGTMGDYNGDGQVDLADLIGFNTEWQPNIGVPCP